MANLKMILDLHAGRVIVCAPSTRKKRDPTKRALKMAIAVQSSRKGFVFP
jgi:hypothetical protein